MGIRDQIPVLEQISTGFTARRGAMERRRDLDERGVNEREDGD